MVNNLVNSLVNNKLEIHFKNLIQQKKIRSGSYGIAGNGNIISCNAMGDMDLGNGIKKAVNIDTIFEIQSITKMITAVAVLILCERGKLSLFDKAGDYIMELNQPPFSNITILHLLTHTSGLVPLEGTFPDRDLNWQRYVDKQDIAHSWIPAVLQKGLFYEPGSKWEYSMMGFCILGEIMARITGKRAEDFIREEILIPCEMQETHWKREVTKEYAKRYQVRTEKHRQQYALSKLQGEKAWIDYCAEYAEIPETAGGLMSTVKDLIQFGIMLSQDGNYKGKQIIKEHSLRLLEENQLQNVRDFCWNHGGVYIAYGAGTAIYDPDFDKAMRVSRKTIYHEGTGTCVLMVNRKDRLAAVWDTPFWTEYEWYAEAVKDTATIIWENEIGITSASRTDKP